MPSRDANGKRIYKRKYPGKSQAEIARMNSQNSGWRSIYLVPGIPSRRQIECENYFYELRQRGDTRRIPRPELDRAPEPRPEPVRVVRTRKSA